MWTLFWNISVQLDDITLNKKQGVGLKGPRWMRHFNFVNFENLIYMKLYSLLILTKKYKKVKKQFISTEKEWNSYISRSYIAM